jgi:hypothetical protein
MGYALSWVAVRGKSGDALRRELAMTPTGAVEDAPRSPLVGARLAGGWSLVLANDDERFLDEGLLARLSSGAEAVACFVDEHVMVSRASGWSDGRRVWMVHHEPPSSGPLELDGELPAAFAAIRARPGDGDARFEAPADLAHAVVGFRHDRPAGVRFEVLSEPTSGKPEPTWSRFFGR